MDSKKAISPNIGKEKKEEYKFEKTQVSVLKGYSFSDLNALLQSAITINEKATKTYRIGENNLERSVLDVCRVQMNTTQSLIEAVTEELMNRYDYILKHK